MKTLIDVVRNDGKGHWVGNGFPVRSLFSYQGDTDAISPFLLLDYAGPYRFEPTEGAPRGVGEHPHRGFETVTIVYDGEVSHRDSTGSGGTIGPGDVQWMTAGAGILHEEFHSRGFSRSGGPFRMVQLWVNLPARHKDAPAAYQAITSDMIPTSRLEGGTARVIAGTLNDEPGPARTFTPINLWDVRLSAGAEVALPLPDGHNSMIAVLSGQITIAGHALGEADIAHLSAEGGGATISADGESMVLVLSGEPIAEPVVARGPFVMNSEAEIQRTIRDFQAGQFGRLTS